MNTEEFRKHGKEMVDYICNYLETIGQRRVTPTVSPGWLKNEIPSEAPFHPEPFDEIMKDIEDKIMPGVTHWQHPRFHAYFPSGNAYPSILGDMLAGAIACIGFSWAASPSCTELETIVLDWLGKAIGLPDQFLTMPSHTIDKKFNDFQATPNQNNKNEPVNNIDMMPKSLGGGVLQGSASECVFVCMLAARAQAIKRLKKNHPFVDEGMLLSKLMAYCSKEAHSCVEKGAMMAFVKLRILEPDEKNSLRGVTLQQVMDQDEKMGLIPFFVSTTLGTTSCCSFDNLAEIGLVCKQFPTVWLHVDAAYAGSAFICSENRGFLNGIEYADSFNMNPNKWLLTNFDCSCMWVKDRYKLTSALVVDPLYLQHGYAGAIDYRHWGLPLSRRFRSLKLWFMLRNYGISGLQEYIRRHCELAKKFKSMVEADKAFEICNDVRLGLVCFRIKDDPTNKLNKKLLESINESGKLHMVPAMVRDKFVIRFCVVAQHANEADMVYAWKVIKELSAELQFIEKRPSVTERNEEQSDEVFELQERKKKDDLAYRRSFFVRMVSDPKIYNPKIAGASPGSRRHTHVSSMDDEFPRSGGSGDIDEEEEEEIATPTTASWISWPLAFLFQGVFDENSSSSDVPVRKEQNELQVAHFCRRKNSTEKCTYVKSEKKFVVRKPDAEGKQKFRHLATKVHFKTKREQREHNMRKSPSPERLAIEDDKSDKLDKSPKHQVRRKLLQTHNQSTQYKQ